MSPNLARNLDVSIDMATLSRSVGRMARAFAATRRKTGLTADEVLIFLALGHLGQTPTAGGVAIRPVTCIDLADVLHMPKETVRRKAARLVDRELASSTTRGLLLENDGEWRRLAEELIG